MATIDPEEALTLWRGAMFEEMGFTPENAELLAGARGPDGWPIDIHRVRKMLQGGCSIELALRIVL